MKGPGGAFEYFLSLITIGEGLAALAAPLILTRWHRTGLRKGLAIGAMLVFVGLVPFIGGISLFLAAYYHHPTTPTQPLAVAGYGLAALGSWLVSGFLAVLPARKKAAAKVTLRTVATNPDGFDRANLEGAATYEELSQTGLLVKGKELPRRSKDEPKAWAWPDPKAHPDRLILGRLYDARGGTGWYVAPHIARLNQTLIVAPPGSGKTFSFAVPWSETLPAVGHSAFVVDVKGNLFEKLSRTRGAAFPIYHFNPMDPAHSIHWNPFDEIDRRDLGSQGFYQAVNDLAEAIHGKVSQGVYNYFETLDQRAIKAGVLLLCLSHDSPTLRDLYELFDSEQTLNTALLFLKQRAEREPALERPARDVARDLDFLFSSKRKDFTEAVSGVRNKLEIFGSPAVCAVTDRSEGFTLKALNETPSLFLCVTPLALGRVGSTLAAIVLRMLARMMVSRFSAKDARKLFLILDEFSKLQMDHDQVEQFISTSREAGCVSVVFLQDVTQIPEEVRAALLANCKDRFILRGAGPETAKWGMALLGERVRYQVSAGQSSNRAGFMNMQQSAGDSLSVTEQSVPVIKPREIMNTGGLRWGAWAVLSDYSSKPILVNLGRA